MADVKTFNVRVSNKYNTHAEWLAADPVLLKGELAIVVVPAEAGVVDQEPALLVKVGDGEKKYSELDFISAYAADVHDWAKASEKPEYTADEIDGLADYISGKVQDTNTQYKVVKVADNSFKLQSKELGGEWVDVEGSAFSFTQYDDTALAGRVTTLEGEMDAVEGRLDVLEGDDATAGSVKNEIKKSIEALDLANTYAAKTHGHEITEVTGLEAALAEKAVKTEVATQISNAQSAVQGNVDALAAKVGEPTEGKTVVQMITDSQYDDEEVRGLISANAEAIDAIEADYLKAADKTELEGKITAAQSAAEAKAAELDAAIAARVKAVEDDYLKAADKTELEGRISGAEGKVNTLIGEDANKSVRTIANEELAAQLIGEDAKESLDTLAEIAAWIQSHPDDAAAMNEAIVALQKQLKDIPAGEGTVKKYVDDAITALNVGQYALAADLTALAGRVTTLEGSAHTHANKTVLDGITADKVTGWDDAVSKAHEHANKTVLDGITAEKVSAWDGKAEADHGHDIADLAQATGYIVLDCGSATKNI